MLSPYSSVPRKAFWKNTAAVRSAEDTSGFYSPRFLLEKESSRVATAGSCFAQHVGRTLLKSGYNVLDVERLPGSVPQEIATQFGYQMYSARYGNIYTARQMRQLLEEAFDGRVLHEFAWEREGVFFDSQRPNVEPSGLKSPEEVKKHRAYHLSRVRELFSSANVFVFTFGLTESWMDADKTTVYPTAPGTIASSFDEDRYSFCNFKFREIFDDFASVRERLKSINPSMKFLITVSPVPLTATATKEHVEVATSRSKCTLRTVCAELFDSFEDIDYFPSYEIITAQASRGRFFEKNLRSVTPRGVTTAMNTFLAAQQRELGDSDSPVPVYANPKPEDDVVCEEVLLEGFAER